MLEWDNYIYLDDPATDLVLNQKIEKTCEQNLKKKQNAQCKLFFKKYLSKSKNNIGLIYFDQGDYVKAIDYFSVCLKIGEELKDIRSSALALGNLANIYYEIGEDDKAVEYYSKSLNHFKSLNDLPKMALTLNHLANVNADNKQFIKAIQNYRFSYNLSLQINDSLGMARSLNNIGNVYRDLKQTDSSLAYLQKSLLVREKINDVKGIVSSINSIGHSLLEKKEYSKTIALLEKNKKLAKEINSSVELRETYQMLAKCYEINGNYKNALTYYTLFNQMKDSILSEENTRAAIQREYKYNYEKKAAEDQIKANEEKKLHKARLAESRANLNYEKTKQYALFGGLFLVLLFSGFMYNRFKVVNKQKLIIEEKEKETQLQKHIVEEKQKEIIDSINYAKRIQEAILPDPAFWNSCFPKNFILYQPKDIVAGDFYWLEKVDDMLFFAAADCTGHGVPGAMVSVVCSNALSKVVQEMGILSTNEILNKTRELVVLNLGKSNKQMRDGMDISLCAFNQKTRELSWSGANNPLLVIENGKSIEFSPDKQPVGWTEQNIPFTQHTIPINQNTMLYLFTDGYADQFGLSEDARKHANEILTNNASSNEEKKFAKAVLAKGKKFKYAQLKTLLCEISDKEMSAQKEVLVQQFNAWKGPLEQVDDVCVIGIKL